MANPHARAQLCMPQGYRYTVQMYHNLRGTPLSERYIGTYSILADSFSHEFHLYTDGLLTGTNLLATWSTT